MKENRDFVDLSKLCFAFLIVFLHVDNNNIIVKNTAQYISRLGVPFFFTISGYFFYKKVNFEGDLLGVTRKTIKRLIKLYLVWIVIYMPILLNNLDKNGDLKENIMRFVQELLFRAPAFQWYTLALAVGLVITVYIYRKNSFQFTIIVLSLLYIVGCFGNTYLHILKLDNIFQEYLTIFLTTRNGLFFSPLFIFMGIEISKFEDKIDKNKYKLASMVCLIAYFFEVYLVQSNQLKNDDCSMYFTLPLVIVFICITILKNNIKVKYSKEMRQLSTFIFCSQYGFIYVTNILLNKIFGFNINPFTFLICILFEISMSFIILRKIKYGRRILSYIT
ncbi:acyltransferase [Terrisporobacter petrolearius]|uniref:acyltransferase n=1 Tax=Terrisporobacter petrolearius TaxID=1460447 RepID=UPI0031CC4ADD